MSDRSIRNLDWLILLSALLLIGTGLLNLYSVGHVPDELRETVTGGPMSQAYLESTLAPLLAGDGRT